MSTSVQYWAATAGLLITAAVLAQQPDGGTLPSSPYAETLPAAQPAPTGSSQIPSVYRDNSTANGTPSALAPPTAGSPMSPAPCIAPAPATGWQRLIAKCQYLFVGYPEEFKEPPLGYFVYLHGRTMVANGEAARMVLYDYDFLPAAAGLNHRGKYQLAKIVAMMPCNFFPLIIQETPCSPELAEARRLAVFNELAKQPFPVPPERVVVGLPIAIGLRGAEAEQINRNLMANTEARGSIGAAAPALSNLLQQAPSVGPGAAVPAGTPPVGQ